MRAIFVVPFMPSTSGFAVRPLASEAEAEEPERQPLAQPCTTTVRLS